MDDLLEPEKAFRMSTRALDARTVEVSFAIADGYYMYRERFRFAARAGVEGAAGGAAVSARNAQEGRVLRRGRDLSQAGGDPVAGGKRRRSAEADGDLAGLRRCRRLLRPDGQQGDDPARRLLGAAGRRADGACAGLHGAGERLRGGAPVRVGRAAARAGELPRLRPAARVHALRAADGADPFRDHRRRRQESRQAARACCCRSAYVLGMAVAYAVAGVAAAWSGTLLASALQNAWVLGAFALVFVALALSMFGFYELQLPGFLHHRLHATHGRLRGGQHRVGRRDGRAVGGHREPLRGGAARRRAALYQPDAGRGARRVGAVRDGARHGHPAAGGRRVRRRAAAQVRALDGAREAAVRRAAARGGGCGSSGRYCGPRAAAPISCASSRSPSSSRSCSRPASR